MSARLPSHPSPELAYQVISAKKARSAYELYLALSPRLMARAGLQEAHWAELFCQDGEGILRASRGAYGRRLRRRGNYHYLRMSWHAGSPFRPVARSTPLQIHTAESGEIRFALPTPR